MVARACQLSFAEFWCVSYNIHRSSYFNFRERYFFWNFMYIRRFSYINWCERYSCWNQKKILSRGDVYVGSHTQLTWKISFCNCKKKKDSFYGGDVYQSKTIRGIHKMSIMTRIFAPLLLSDNEHPMQKQHCRLCVCVSGLRLWLGYCKAWDTNL